MLYETVATKTSHLNPRKSLLDMIVNLSPDINLAQLNLQQNTSPSTQANPLGVATRQPVHMSSCAAGSRPIRSGIGGGNGMLSPPLASIQPPLLGNILIQLKGTTVSYCVWHDSSACMLYTCILWTGTGGRLELTGCRASLLFEWKGPWQCVKIWIVPPGNCNRKCNLILPIHSYVSYR